MDFGRADEYVALWKSMRKYTKLHSIATVICTLCFILLNLFYPPLLNYWIINQNMWLSFRLFGKYSFYIPSPRNYLPVVLGLFTPGKMSLLRRDYFSWARNNLIGLYISYDWLDRCESCLILSDRFHNPSEVLFFFIFIVFVIYLLTFCSKVYQSFAFDYYYVFMTTTTHIVSKFPAGPNKMSLLGGMVIIPRRWYPLCFSLINIGFLDLFNQSGFLLALLHCILPLFIAQLWYEAQYKEVVREEDMMFGKPLQFVEDLHSILPDIK